MRQKKCVSFNKEVIAFDGTSNILKYCCQGKTSSNEVIFC